MGKRFYFILGEIMSSPNTNINEHYLRASGGTQTACSCGKTFAFASDANQHIRWQLRTQALLAAAKIEELQMLPVNYNRPRTSRFVPYSVIEERIKVLKEKK
jgi:hypothetical protein